MKTNSPELSILLIDDMKPLVLILENGLKRLGQTVFTAFSGEEGIEVFQSRDVDVVICDLGMEGLSGWDVGLAVKEICEKRGKPKTPFVLLTGWGCDADDHANLAAFGVDLVLEKPIDISYLLKILGEIRSKAPDTEQNDIRPELAT
jgi:CheY-like chemotaxis protein